MNNLECSQKIILGLDPGRDKCGVAVIEQKKAVYHQVIDSTVAIAIIKKLCQQYQVQLVVMGNGTTSQQWRSQLQSNLNQNIAIVTVNETNSTVEARARYWQMYSPQGWQRLLPQGLRVPPRPVDDIVAILLIERYLTTVSDKISG